MDVLDDDGRLFGVVNIIDALVVLFVVAVVVAGAALIFSDDPDPEPDIETTHATLDLGTQPDVIVDELNEGDSYQPAGDDAPDELTITDIHLTPQGNNVRVIVRAELVGEPSDESVNYDGAPPRIGRSLDIVTDRYQVSGTVRQVGDSASLQRTTTDVVIEDVVDAQDAEAIAPGDEIQLRDRPAATVQSISSYGTQDPDQKRVFVGLSVETLAYGDRIRYGDTPVQRGSQLDFRTDTYQLSGQIQRVGTLEEPGTAGTRTVTLRLGEVRERVAEGIRPGMTEANGGETVAEITDVRVEPSTFVVTTEDGDVRAHDHPVDRDVTITAELSVRETTTGVRFKGSSLRQGDTVTLDLGTTTIQPTVERIE